MQSMGQFGLFGVLCERFTAHRAAVAAWPGLFRDFVGFFGFVENMPPLTSVN